MFDRRAFILSETILLPVPHVPEIRLHVAHEAIALWQKTEEELGEIGLPQPILRGVAVTSRAAGLVGHILEERNKPAARHIWHLAETGVPYAEDPGSP